MKVERGAHHCTLRCPEGSLSMKIQCSCGWSGSAAKWATEAILTAIRRHLQENQ